MAPAAPSRLQRPWWIALALGALLAGMAVGYLALQSPPAPPLGAGTRLPNPRPLGPFALTDHLDRPVTPERLRGRWTLLAFGYTLCPDVCPTLLTTLAAVEGRLRAQGVADPPRFMFVSVDPARDSAARLKEYLAYFSPGLIGVRGADANLKEFTSQLGIIYAKIEDQQSALGYLMDHSTTLILIDPEVRLHALFSAPHDAQALAADLRALIGPASR